MSDTPFGLKQVTKTVWIGEELTQDQVQFLDSTGIVNEPPDSTVLLEVSYHLELYRRMCESTVQTHLERTSEGYYCVYIDGTEDAAFWSVIQADAIRCACSFIEWYL